MNTLISRWQAKEESVTPVRRSVSDTVALLDQLALGSASLIAKPLGAFIADEQVYRLPHYLFVGPKGGSDPIQIGLFAGIHGDEPAGVYALIELLALLEVRPDLATDYLLHVYPICNPTGFEDNTRHSRRGRDLNREFWRDSREPEVRVLERELVTNRFDGLIALHADNTSHGLYGFASGATLTRHLLEPALASAEQVLPRNTNTIIDGFNAQNGIIREGYEGVLSAPLDVKSRPFEIILETPDTAPAHLQQEALVAALRTILAEYRKLIAYAPNL